MITFTPMIPPHMLTGMYAPAYHPVPALPPSTLPPLATTYYGTPATTVVEVLRQKTTWYNTVAQIQAPMHVTAPPMQPPPSMAYFHAPNGQHHAAEFHDEQWQQQQPTQQQQQMHRMARKCNPWANDWVAELSRE